MARQLGWLGLLAFLMLGTAVWTLWPAPCSKPIAYRLGPDGKAALERLYAIAHARKLIPAIPPVDPI